MGGLHDDACRSVMLRRPLLATRPFASLCRQGDDRMAGLQWALFKSRLWMAFLPEKREQQGVAKEITERAIVVARDLVHRQRAALEAASDDLGFRLNGEMLLSIELNFLWGVFSNLVADGPALPTNGFDRVVLHIAHYLVREHGVELGEAIANAKRVEGLYNEAELVFEAISSRGRDAYRDGTDHHFVQIALALHRSGLAPAAYA
jgi:hypothetical protein